MQERMITSIEKILSRCSATYGQEFMRTELLKNLQDEDVVCTIQGGFYADRKEMLLSKETGIVVTDREEVDMLASKKRFEILQNKRKCGKDVSDQVWDHFFMLHGPMVDINDVRYKLKKSKETHTLTYKCGEEDHYLEYLFISRDHDFFKMQLHPNGDFFVKLEDQFKLTNPVPLLMVKGMKEIFSEMEIWADLLLDKESKKIYR